ncbi:MAG: T9SS type A sorting domain-containing protein [Bacteroidia bacterium]|nr:T9SS type A sorting domain-containing protein [Bacteroidia bacterium]NNJ56179.1 T9SS type A sorting domain-containing protein [Bacteroidia bacterium]
MKKIILITTMLVLALTTSAQTDVKLTINHFLGSSDFAFNSDAQNDMGDDFKLQRMEYYISEISITHDGGMVTNAFDVYTLQRANKRDTILLGNFNITSVEAINFSIGVDPGVNNGNPAQWDASHALSPKNPSMHWGWASGYRFVAMEGKSGVNFAQDFQIHALGNKNFFNQTIATGAETISGALVIALNADYTKAVSQIGMASGLIEHSENNEAAACLRNFQTKVFTSLSGEASTASVQNLELVDAFAVLPVPSAGEVDVVVEDTRFLQGSMIVTDITGREIYKSQVNSSNKLTIETKGMYFITLYGDGIKSTKKLIIE